MNGPLLNSRAPTPLHTDRARISLTLRVPKGFPYNSRQAHSSENKNNKQGLGGWRWERVSDARWGSCLSSPGGGAQRRGCCSPPPRPRGSLTVPVSASVSPPVTCPVSKRQTSGWRDDLRGGRGGGRPQPGRAGVVQLGGVTGASPHAAGGPPASDSPGAPGGQGSRCPGPPRLALTHSPRVF